MAEVGVRSDVRDLFLTRSIAEIREAEAALRHQVEEKQQSLRSLIGDSYGDLIGSADALAEAARESAALAAGARGLQEGMGRLSSPLRPQPSVRGWPGMAPGPPGRDPSPGISHRPLLARHRDILYNLGLVVKFLLDTPEAAWALLERGKFVEAACRYLAAHALHRDLPPQASAGFPLLAHHWPTCLALRAEVAERARAALKGGTAAAAAAGDDPTEPAGPGRRGLAPRPPPADADPAAEACSALCALALLTPLDGAALLRALLEARRLAVAAPLLEAGRGAAASAPAPAGAEALRASSRASARVLTSALADAAELFGVLPGVTREPRLARELRRLAEGGGTPSGRGDGDPPARDGGVSPGATAVTAAAAAAAKRVSELGPGGAALELGGWFERALEGARGAATEAAGALARDGADLRAAVGGAAEAETAFRRTIEGEASSATLEWPDLAQWALSRPVALATEVWDRPARERAADIGRQAFGDATVLGQAAVAGALEAADADEGALWAYVDPDGAEGSPSPPSGWRTGAATASATCESALHAAAAAAVDAARGAHARAGDVGGSVAAAATEAGAGLIAALAAAVKGGGRGEGADGGAAAYPVRALTIGRIASALATSPALDLALSPSRDWEGLLGAAAAEGAPGVPGARPGRAPGATEAAARATRVAAEAHALAAGAVASAIAAPVRAALAQDLALVSRKQLRAWRLLSLPPPADGDEPIRFSLPAAPSPAVLGAALATSRAAVAAGGAEAAPGAVADISSRARDVLLAALASRGGAGPPTDPEADPPAALSEPGALQLLFDARYLSLALPAAGGPPAPGRRPAKPADLAAAEAPISARLDPIDWATFDAPLEGEARRALASTHGLLAPLSGTAGAVPAPAGPQPPPPQPLALAPPAQRLQYLPAPTPSADGGGRGARATASRDGRVTGLARVLAGPRASARGPRDAVASPSAPAPSPPAPAFLGGPSLGSSVGFSFSLLDAPSSGAAAQPGGALAAREAALLEALGGGAAPAGEGAAPASGPTSRPLLRGPGGADAGSPRPSSATAPSSGAHSALEALRASKLGSALLGEGSGGGGGLFSGFGWSNA